jgi:hypothetical protein
MSPLISRGGHGYKSVSVLAKGFYVGCSPSFVSASSGTSLLCRRGPTTSQPPPEVVATIWYLTVRGCLPLCGLPRVSLLEASLVHKEPPFPRRANERARSPLPLELRELLVLMHHARCLTLLSEWLTAPRGHLNGQTVQHLCAYQALGA